MEPAARAVDPLVIIRALRLLAAYPLQFLAISSVGFVISLPQVLLRGGIWSTPLSLLLPVATELVGAALICGVATAADGGNPNVLGSFRLALERIGRLLLVTLWWLGSVVLLAITFVGLPFAIRQLIRWSFGTQGVMLRNLNRRDALDRSARVVDGHWWQWLALWASMAIPLAALGWLPIIIAWSYSTQPLLISSLLGIIFGPISLSVMTLAYLERIEQLEAANGSVGA